MLLSSTALSASRLMECIYSQYSAGNINTLGMSTLVSRVPRAFGVWYLVCGIWCVVFGVWYLVCGIWCVVFGVWYLVCGI